MSWCMMRCGQVGPGFINQGPGAPFLRGEPRGWGKFAGSSFGNMELRWLPELSEDGVWLGVQTWGHGLEKETRSISEKSAQGPAS